MELDTGNNSNILPARSPPSSAICFFSFRTSGSPHGGPASVPATLEYAYKYDDIGNRITSTDLTTIRTYTANSLNQYSAITTSDFRLQTFSFEPHVIMLSACLQFA